MPPDAARAEALSRPPLDNVLDAMLAILE